MIWGRHHVEATKTEINPQLTLLWNFQNFRHSILWDIMIIMQTRHSNRAQWSPTGKQVSSRASNVFFYHTDMTYWFNILPAQNFYMIFLFNLVVTVSRAGRFTITNQQCSDALQDNNFEESTQLSSIVVSGVSDILLGGVIWTTDTHAWESDLHSVLF